MKILTFLFAVLCSTTLTAQMDAIESFFEKEAPEFQVNIRPDAAGNGQAVLEVYYTHSRATQLEVSFWMIDRGDRRLNTGDKKLIGQLQTTSNRQPVTLAIDNLKDGDFYGFGVDYRRPSGLITRTFESKYILDGYQHEGRPKEAVTQRTTEVKQTPSTSEFSAKEVAQVQNPCTMPKIRLAIRETGYCQDENTPALLIQNKVNQNWQFTIEVQNQYGYWQSMYGSDRRLSAKGAITRTEPLCLLQNGLHNIRVRAWGENCETPVVQALQTPVRIRTSTNMTAKSIDEKQPHEYNFLPKQKVNLPDTCVVLGDAVVRNGKISGYVQLDSRSPCARFDPYVVVRYVYPGYRDIALEPMRLIAGEKLDFDIELNTQDLSRTIHPINVLTYIPIQGSQEGELVSAFWIRPENQSAKQPLATDIPAPPSQPEIKEDPQSREPAAYSYDNTTIDESSTEVPTTSSTTPRKVVDLTKPQVEPANTYNENDYTLTQEANVVSVTAGDPNCTQISDLQLVYDLQRSNQPLFISWLSPRCCQEEGCEYTIWAGQKPDELSLMMKGYKPGATIRELINPDLSATATYYEIVVKTKNGTRKAAYVIGEGPKYGYEDILAYHDQFKALQSSPIAYEQTVNKGGTQAATQSKEENSFQWKASAELLTPPADYRYEYGTMPIERFQPCKYKNELHLVADDPIHTGDEVTLTYDYNRPGYQYTLYQRPKGQSEWYVAPNTKELQDKAQFYLKAGQYHNGDYLVLLYKTDKGWGCLSETQENAFSIEVKE
ncbi:MAG: hypothetical protein AAGI23_15080 [Bacteroidota bacterium]